MSNETMPSWAKKIQRQQESLKSELDKLNNQKQNPEPENPKHDEPEKKNPLDVTDDPDLRKLSPTMKEILKERKGEETEKSDNDFINEMMQDKKKILKPKKIDRNGK